MNDAASSPGHSQTYRYAATLQGRIVNSHNAEKFARNESVCHGARPSRAPVARARSEAELRIDDEFDRGGDPYNSTGRHVIITAKIKRED